MGYLSSVIILQKDGLYRAEIRYLYMFFFTYIDHESFRTLGEAKDWILSRRCPDFEEQEYEEDEEEDEEQDEEDEEQDSEGSVYESDYDSDCEETEQDRNVRLNIQYNRSKTLDDIKTMNRRSSI